MLERDGVEEGHLCLVERLLLFFLPTKCLLLLHESHQQLEQLRWGGKEGPKEIQKR